MKSTDENNNTNKKKTGWAYIIPAFIFISLIPLFSLISRFTTHYPGAGELEGWIWRYWWMKQMLKSVLNSQPLNLKLLIYTYITAGNFPETGNVFDLQTMSLILEPIFGAPTYYNVKLFIILFLNGICGFMLCRYLTKKTNPSLVGGAILILNPFIIREVSHGRIRQAILFTMPLFILYLFRAYRERRTIPAIWAGFWLGVTAAVYLYYGMAALFFGLIFLLFHIIFDRKNFHWSFLLRILVILVIFVIISGTFSYRYIQMAAKGDRLPEVRWFPDFPLVKYLMPGGMKPADNPDLANSLMRFHRDTPPLEYPVKWNYEVNVPVVVTVLVLIPLIFVRPFPWFWFITCIFFYILSLGPYLRFGPGLKNYIMIGERGLPLPYIFLYKYVPFFARLFAPTRWLGFGSVAVSVLISINLSFIQKKISDIIRSEKLQKILKPALAVTVILLIIIQMWTTRQIPFPVNRLDVPSVYYEMARENELYGIVEIPFRAGDYPNYYQVIHGKKLLGGWASVPREFPRNSYADRLAQRDDHHLRSFIEYMDQLNRFDRENPPVLSDHDLEILKNLGYKYVIVHQRGCGWINDPENEHFFNYIVDNLESKLGKPEFTTENVPLMHTDIKSPVGKVAIFKIRD